jgi:predicted phosphoribosyltransferase
MRQRPFSVEGPSYQDRAEAGRELAQRLRAFAGQNPLVLGIPRGGVPLAFEVARALDADLDIVVARKLRAPGQPELAIGAVTANGGRYLNEQVLYEMGVSPEYLAAVTLKEREEARSREIRLRGGHPRIDPGGRTVLLVDDGLATGATMRAAVQSLRAARPARLIVAVPVGARDTCERLADQVDELIVLAQPEPFWAVGLFYRDFSPVDDGEVVRLMDRARRVRAGRGQGPEPEAAASLPSA